MRRRSALVILFSCLLILSTSGCSDADNPTGPAGPAFNDFWPMSIGNTWTFNYTSSFRDWDVYEIGKPIEGSYIGTLSWEFVSIAESPSEVRRTFKQRFVGVASEYQLRSKPSDYVTVQFDIVDTASTFDLTIQADQIIRLSADAYPTWQHKGSLCAPFQFVDVFRYPETILDSITFSDQGHSAVVRLARKKGPLGFSYSYGGNTQRRNLSANLISYTQHYEQVTDGLLKR